MLPSLKERNRYIAFKIVSKDKINSFGAISQAVWDSALNLLGELELGKAGLRLFKDNYSPQQQTGVLKVTNKYVNKIITSLALIEEINGVKVAVNTTGTSGILKKAKKRYLAS